MRKFTVIWALLCLVPATVLAEATGTTQTTWLFNTSLEGWFAVNLENQLLDTESGWWVIDPGDDIRLVSPMLTRSPSSINYVKFLMKNKGGPDTRGRFYFSADGGSMSETNSKGFTLENDYVWYWISLRLDDIPGWGGSNIDQIRIDPVMFGCSPETCPDDILFDAILLRKDTTNPVVTGLSVNPSGWTNTNSFTFSWTKATDGPDDGSYTGYGSGVDYLQYRRGSQSWLTYGKDETSLTWSAYQQGDNTFYINAVDVVGLISATKSITYKYDSTLPSNPTAANSNSHSPGDWSSDNTIQVSWSGATDAHSGINGYSWIWTTSSGSIPNTSLSGTGTSMTSDALASGSSWYFHVRSQDNAGNWGSTATVLHYGPFKIDTTKPSNPTTLQSTSHLLAVCSSNNRIRVTWSGAADTYSGVSGYSWMWDTSPATRPDETADGSATAITSPPLTQGNNHYFHLITRDAAGNWSSGTVHLGPFCIEESAPGSPASVSCPDDETIPPFSLMETLTLDGFTITNVSLENLSFYYEVSSEGPATLVDQGLPAAISGTTPVLGPSESYSPPDAALLIPEINDYDAQVVTYSVIPTAYPDMPNSCSTVINLEPPIAVLIESFRARPVLSRVEISWEVSTDENIKGYRIYRKAAGQAVEKPVNAGILLPPDTESFVDGDILGGKTYQYVLGVVREDNLEVRSQTVEVKTIAHVLTLYQNFPNPFNPSTRISFTLPDRVRVNLSVFNSEGKLVVTLVDEISGEGFREAVWDGTDSKGVPVSSGVYFYRLKAGKKILTRKMVLLK